MLKMNNTGVKKVNVNGNRVHKVKVNGTVVFDDQCYADWNVEYYSYGNRAGSISASLKVDVFRNDSYPNINAKVKVVTQDANGTKATNYYDLPLSSWTIIASGGWSAGIYGDWCVWVYINDVLITSWDFNAHSELIYDYYYNGRQYFYES